MHLAYDGALWTGGVLERVLDDEVRRARVSLVRLLVAHELKRPSARRSSVSGIDEALAECLGGERLVERALGDGTTGVAAAARASCRAGSRRRGG